MARDRRRSIRSTNIGHYFYTLDAVEIEAISAGAAGPGWVRTGLSFSTYASIAQSGDNIFPTCDLRSSPCIAISRFYGTPGLGPNSHFFTGNPVEVNLLNLPGSGWTYERPAFAVPLTDPATGQCAEGYGYTPVYRLYNNRWMFNDSNHRYTTSQAVRSRMRAEGWADEGIAFCAYNGGQAPIVSHAINVKTVNGIQSQADCDAESSLPRSCIAVSNLSVPAVEFSAAQGSPSNDEFNASTGIFYMGNPKVSTNVARLSDSRGAAAQDFFVQLTDWGTVFGINLVAPPRSGQQYSSVTPMHRLPVSNPAPGTADTRLFPFRTQFNTEYELRLDFSAGVNRLVVSEGSHAYGVAAIEFADTRSGGRFRAHILAYGTAPAGDIVARDDVDGRIFVGTSFKPQSSFGHAGSGLTVHMPASYYPLAPYLNPFIWSINRAEFQALVNIARGLDPVLSADPGDYLVASFGIKNQILGSGNLAFYAFGAGITLMPR